MRHRKAGRQLRRTSEQTLALMRNLAERRLAGRHIQKRAAADRLFQQIGPRSASRKGGYTRILKMDHCKGNGADMARIELIEG